MAYRAVISSPERTSTGLLHARRISCNLFTVLPEKPGPDSPLGIRRHDNFYVPQEIKRLPKLTLKFYRPLRSDGALAPKAPLLRTSADSPTTPVQQIIHESLRFSFRQELEDYRDLP